MSTSKKKFNQNDFFKDLAEQLESDEGLTVVEWIQKNNFKTSDGIPFDFKKFPFMVQILNEESKQVAVMSSAQLGKTEGMYMLAIKKCLEGNNVIFTEPVEDLRNILVKTKLNPLIANNPSLKDRIKGDLSAKQVGSNSLFTIYTNGAGLVGFSARINIYDEVSMSNPDNIALLRGRQLAQEDTKEIWLSNPRMPHDMLHSKFLESTQNHWTIRCSHCNKWQIMNYDGMYGMKGNICKKRHTFVCQHCDEELEPHVISEGRWVERYPNRDIKGYWLHQMMRYCKDVHTMRERATELIQQESDNIETFLRMFMGLPYAGSTVNFNEELFYPLCGQEDPQVSSKNYVLGLDIGASEKESGGHHYIYGNDYHILEMGTFKTLDEAEEFIVKKNVNMCVSDYLPDYERVKTMQAKFPNIVWRAYFKGTRSDNDIKFDGESGMVLIPKHTTFDSIADDFKEKKFSFGYDEKHPVMKEFMRQFSTVSKIPGFDSNGNPSYKWEAPKGADDHFAMTFCYYYVARERWETMRHVHGIYNSNDIKQETEMDWLDELFGEQETSSDWMDY